MSRIVAIVRLQREEELCGLDLFLADDEVTDPAQAARDAVTEFLATDFGKSLLTPEGTRQSAGFTWGKAMVYVPEEIWRKHGLLWPVDGQQAVVIVVDEDEVLSE